MDNPAALVHIATMTNTKTSATTLKNRAIRALNAALWSLTRNTYFDGIPVNAMADLAYAAGFETEDFEGIYTGREGHTTIQMALREAPSSGLRTPKALGYLHFTWHKMDLSGRYEIVAYAN